MLSLINHIVKITMNDGRTLMGKMLAFDRHMNLVLADCEEFRRIKKKRKQGDQEVSESVEQKRTLGLVILRGETIVSLTDEGAPPSADDEKKGGVRMLCLCSRTPTDWVWNSLCLDLDVVCLLVEAWA